MRVVFMGTPEFAVPSLEALRNDDSIDVTLVVTQPDRPASRGRRLVAPAVKVAAERLEIPVFQPETIRDEDTFARLEHECPDLIVVVSYGEILRENVLQLPEYGCINVHPSLLPEYRGPIPIPAAILNGDPETGVTIMKLVREMDAGPILDQFSWPLDAEIDAGTLTVQLAELAGRHLPDVVRRWVTGEITPREQDHERATYTRLVQKSDAQIDWRTAAESIERFVRAMHPEPGAWSVADSIRYSIGAVRVADETGCSISQPGTIRVAGSSVFVWAEAGLVELLQIQPAGKKRMNVADWVNGLRGATPAAFDSPGKQASPLIVRRQ